MQQDEIHAVLAGVLAQAAHTDPAGITPDKRLRDDLGLDSLTTIDVAGAAEDRFGVRIKDDDVERFQTVADALDYISRSRRERNDPPDSRQLRPIPRAHDMARNVR